jgi:hypothetical protein
LTTFFRKTGRKTLAGTWQQRAWSTLSLTHPSCETGIMAKTGALHGPALLTHRTSVIRRCQLLPTAAFVIKGPVSRDFIDRLTISLSSRWRRCLQKWAGRLNGPCLYQPFCHLLKSLLSTNGNVTGPFSSSSWMLKSEYRISVLYLIPTFPNLVFFLF